MSAVRPLAVAEAPEVAALFLRVFRNSNKPALASFEAYLKWFFLEGPLARPGISPLVHLDDGGRVTGFIGVHTLPMRFGDKTLLAAFCGSLMVENPETAPLAGARLLKAFLSGPQDASFSETVNEVSHRMWLLTGGETLPGHSLNWIRVLKPAGLAVALAERAVPAFRVLGPLARGLDRLHGRRIAGGAQRWSGLDPVAALPGQLKVNEISSEAFGRLLKTMTEHYAFAPTWDETILTAQLADAFHKPDYGAPVVAEVATRSGAPIGGFFYHARPGGIARVLQTLARPGQEGAVLDHLIRDAAERGAVGIVGRTQPALLPALLTRRVVLLPRSATVMHVRDPALAETLRAGRGFLNGFSGETWSRIVGGGAV